MLDHFYAALLKGEGVHIIHYGDSPTTADLITADARALFQHEFGDGGVGFVLLARPWAWYNRRGVEMSASNWKIDIGGNSPLKDGLQGLGAVSFRGAPGAVARWKVKDAAHRSVEIAYSDRAARRRFRCRGRRPTHRHRLVHVRRPARMRSLPASRPSRSLAARRKSR